MPARRLQFVVKITKHCNLRCQYCYEFADLDDRRRLTIPAIASVFRNIAKSRIAQEAAGIEFIWHGGEPLMVPLPIYEEIAAIQHDVFSADPRLTNVLQTNLTILTDRHLDFLKSGRFFHEIGVSFDVYGGQRVDSRGHQRQERILANMERLTIAGIPFSAIAVLCRSNLDQVRDIYAFYDRRGLPFRLLPIDSESYEGQGQRHGVTGDEIVAAMNDLLSAFLMSPRATPVEPIDSYLDYATRALKGRHDAFYDKGSEESILVLDRDATLYGEADAYRPEGRYGNLAEESLDDCFASPERQAQVTAAAARQDRFCNSCPHYGACPGYFVGDAQPLQRAMLEVSDCPVRGCLDAITALLPRLLPDVYV